MSATHDSTPDTLAHIERVNELLDDFAQQLEIRGLQHDASKLREPEKSAFDRLKALSLSGMTYGSPEYRECLRKEEPAIQHHYSENSHHPEHYENGVNGMDLLDLVEMLCDWKAASERMQGGGDIIRSIGVNTERFKLSPQLVEIFQNTALRCGWLDSTPPKGGAK